jgi:hypothetical protein
MALPDLLKEGLGLKKDGPFYFQWPTKINDSRKLTNFIFVFGIIGRDIKGLFSEDLILFLLEFEKCYKIAIISTNQQLSETFTRALGRKHQHILRNA